jgi:hypothetical protein
VIGKRGGQALDGNLQRVTASVTASEAPSRSSKSESGWSRERVRFGVSTSESGGESRVVRRESVVYVE